MHELGHLMSQITVREIMSRNLITVSPDYTLEETAAQLVLNHISGAPVIDDQGELVGIISQREIFMALISLTGYGKKGLQLAFQVEDRAGSVKELTETIGDYGGRLVSLLTSTSRAPAGHRYVYVRIYDLHREKMPELLDKLTDKATLLYMVDHRENKREEYGKRSLYLDPKVTGAKCNKEKHAGHQSVTGSDSPPSDENRVDCSL
jgi:acetoin utilization protein AcuB